MGIADEFGAFIAPSKKKSISDEFGAFVENQPKPTVWDNLMQSDTKVDTSLINVTPEKVRSIIDSRNKAISDKHNKLDQLLGDSPLEMPVVSPEFALGAPVRMGQGLIAKALGEKIVGDAMLKGGAAYGVGSVVGDIGAQAGIEGVDAALTDNFKEQHPDITNAIRMTAALGLGGTLGYKAEMKALNPTQKAKIIKGVDEGKISPEKAQEIFDNDAKVANAMSDNMEADFKAKEAPQAVNNVTNDIPTQPITPREQFIQDVTKARGEEEALMNINLIDAKAKTEGITTDDWLTKNGLKVEQHATDGAEFAGKGDSLNQPAYHGTPHEVDAFDTAKIGTGEGAQAYGHGLYFAGDKKVAEWYKEKLSKETLFKDGTVELPYDAKVELRNMDYLGFSTAQEAAQAIAQKPKAWKQLWDAEHEVTPSIDKWVAENVNGNQGNLYKVDLKPTDDELLHWDRPLSEQGNKTKEALASAGHYDEKDFSRYIELKNELDTLDKQGKLDTPEWNKALTEKQALNAKLQDYDGEGLYQSLTQKLGSDAKASQYLRERGIKGIKYVDGTSRNTMTLHITPPERTVSGKWMVKSNDYNSVGRHFDTEVEAKSFLEHEKNNANHNYVIFHNDDVAITGANGKMFDGSPDELFQKLPSETVNALVQFGAKSKEEVNIIIRLFKTADVSSIPHELAHVFRRNLSPQELRSAEKAFGVVDGKWTVEAEERFAEGFVKWLSEGKAPTKELHSTFKQFKSWLKDLWLTLIKSKEQGFVLTKEHKEFYKAMMGDKEAAKKLFSAKAKNARAQRIAMTAEVPVGGSEDMAKQAVKNEFKKQPDSRYKNMSKDEIKALEEEHARALYEEADALFQKAPSGSRLEEWHKDSHPLTKNADGTPKVFYHGTNKSFDAFDITKAGQKDDGDLGKGIYFAFNPNTAEKYAGKEAQNIIPTYLNLKNPLVLNKGEFNKLWDIFGGEEKYYTDLHYKKLTKEKVSEKLKSLGHDGVIDNGYGQISVFEPTQIKSIHNRGTFDETNPNILFQKIVDESGQPKEVAKAVSDVIKKNIIERGTDAVIKAPFRIVAYAIKKADNIVSTSKMGGLYKEIKAIGDSDLVDVFTGHKIYQRHDYMDMRDHALQSVNRASEKVLRMHSQLAELSDQAREAMYDYMTGYKDQVQLSPELKRLADNMTRTIDDAGQKMVDNGFLSEQAYEDWKGQYLHRRYTSKMKTAGDIVKGKGQFNVDTIQERGKRWNGTADEYYNLEKEGLIGRIADNKVEADLLPNGEYSFRRDWTREERTAMGEIRDIAYSFPETYARMAQMIEYGKMLKAIPDQYIMLQGTKTDKTMASLGYIKMEGDRYGALNGQWVDKTIARDIRHTNEDIMGADMNKDMANLREAYKSYVSLWKQSHTVFNTTAHVNNLTSNVIMQFSAGLSPRKAMTYAYDGGVALKKFGVWSKLNARKLTGLTQEESVLLHSIENDADFKMLLEVQDQGLFGRSQLNDMLNSYMSPSVPTAESAVGKAVNSMQKLYEAEDNIMRFAAYKQLREAGMEAQDAVKVINRDIIPDYSKPMSEVARKLRNSGFVPFMSWMYYSTPILVKQMANNPSRTAVLIAGIYAIDKSFGVDPYDAESMPQDGFATQRMVIGRNGSKVTGLRIQSMIPQSQFADPYETYVRSLATGGVPQTIAAAIADVNLYYKQPVTTQTGIVGAYQRTKNVVQNVMPTPDVLDKMYNIAEANVLDKKTRKSSAVYEPRSAGQEAASFFLNTLTYDVKKQRQKVRNEHDRERDN